MPPNFTRIPSKKIYGSQVYANIPDNIIREWICEGIISDKNDGCHNCNYFGTINGILYFPCVSHVSWGAYEKGKESIPNHPKSASNTYLRGVTLPELINSPIMDYANLSLEEGRLR